MDSQRELFDFMLKRINEVGIESGLRPPQAFGKWFASTYFQEPTSFKCPDGSGDGKVDCFFDTVDGSNLTHVVVNLKFTETYNRVAPPLFYDEITRFWQAFANASNRNSYLSTVRKDLHAPYRSLFRHFDNGDAQLFFVTNHRRNERQYESIKNIDVRIFHLEDLLQFMVDYIEDAMPIVPRLELTNISSVLSADKRDTTVPTSIVFARVVDLIKYMQEQDPYDLLFARNIRLKLQHSRVNPEIAKTFKEKPSEFVFSNNGITMLCESHSHDPGSQQLTIENPRVVNGSQTLHSIREVPEPSSAARVMLRIIQVASPTAGDLSRSAVNRREIISKISIRSNLQNPIKKWNLIANDISQHELARFFRKHKLYYERRDGEWAQRRLDLKAVGIRRGPNIKSLAQLVASYYWESDCLGPVVAKRALAELFNEESYRVIGRTSHELVYQIYLLGNSLDYCIKRLATKSTKSLSKYGRLALFALIVKALQQSHFAFGNPEATDLLERGAVPEQKWLAFCRLGLSTIRQAYDREARAYLKRTGKDLTIANFSKGQEYVGRLLQRRIPAEFHRFAAEMSKGVGSGRKT